MELDHSWSGKRSELPISGLSQLDIVLLNYLLYKNKYDYTGWFISSETIKNSNISSLSHYIELIFFSVIEQTCEFFLIRTPFLEMASLWRKTHKSTLSPGKKIALCSETGWRYLNFLSFHYLWTTLCLRLSTVSQCVKGDHIEKEEKSKQFCHRINAKNIYL